MNTFIGLDLGWYGKPSGLAAVGLVDGGLYLQRVIRLEEPNEILQWIEAQAGSGDSVVAADAPLVIRNDTSIRPAERELNRWRVCSSSSNTKIDLAPKTTPLECESETCCI